jgi:DNA-binding HxlR family transcriptional regulator
MAQTRAGPPRTGRAVRRTRFDRAYCPIARTTDLLGDWWTPLLLRELMLGKTRFAELQEELDISKAVLTQRLRRLEDEAVIERRSYQDRPVRYDYVLTNKGRALWDVLLTMWQFGDDWLFRDGAGIELFDTSTGEPITAMVVNTSTARPIDPHSTSVRFRARG